MKRKQRGNTLVETVVSLGVLSLLGGGVFGMIGESEEVFQASLRNQVARQDTVQSFEVLRAELRQASLATIQIDQQAPHGDEIRFQVPLSLHGPDIVWGAVQTIDRQRYEFADHVVRFRLVAREDGTRDLVREVLSPDGQRIGEARVLARQVDAVDEHGSKGFRVERDGRFVSVALRLRLQDADDGTTHRRTHSNLLRIRNS